MKRMLRLDWDVIAGIAAAVIAVILHLLHIADVDVLLTISLVLLALLLFRDLRREGHDEAQSRLLLQTANDVAELQLAVRPPDAILIGPRLLRSESRRFCEMARGETLWFNVCFLMFKTQDVFDLMLRPAIENPAVTSIQFVADRSEQEHWQEHMLPKIQDCVGRAKVLEPRWADLPQTVSFIVADVDQDGKTEALLSFWGEPFMAQSTGQQVPRYVFRVQSHSDLVERLVEVERGHRMSR